MSNLRRTVLSDRFFFITCRVYRPRRKLSEAEFAVLAEVVRERRKARRFLLAAWVFLPDHWHAIIFPRSPLTISRVMESIKVGGTRRINAGRSERGVLLQGRFFDRALRTVKEYNEKVAYIHWNPVKAGLVKRPEDWPWSSVHDYTGTVNAPSGKAGSADSPLLRVCGSSSVACPIGRIMRCRVTLTPLGGIRPVLLRHLPAPAAPGKAFRSRI